MIERGSHPALALGGRQSREAVAVIAESGVRGVCAKRAGRDRGSVRAVLPFDDNTRSESGGTGASSLRTWAAHRPESFRLAVGECPHGNHGNERPESLLVNT